MNGAPYVGRKLYICFEKDTFNTWYEKHAFYHPLKSLMFTYYNLCILKMYW